MTSTSTEVPTARAETPIRRERRTHKRHPFKYGMSCKSVDLASGPAWLGECRNLSRQGIQIVAERRFEPNTVLLIDLAETVDLSIRSFLAQVIWAERNFAGGWLLGCSLVHPLSEEDLNGLVGDTTHSVVISLPDAPSTDDSFASPSSANWKRRRESDAAPGREPIKREPSSWSALDRLRERGGSPNLELRLPSRRAARRGEIGKLPPGAGSDAGTATDDALSSSTDQGAKGPASEERPVVAEAPAPEPPPAPPVPVEPEEDLVAQELLASLTEHLDNDNLNEALEAAVALRERNPDDLETISVLAYLHDRLDEPDTIAELRCFAGHRSSVNSVAFSRDGQWGFGGSGGEYLDGYFYDGKDRSLRVWELATGREVGRFSENGSPILTVASSTCGSLLAVGSRNGGLSIMDASDVANSREVGRHRSMVCSVAFAPDGNHILTGCEDGVVRLWDLHGNRLHKYEGHTATITGVAFSPDGRWIASSSLDRTLRLWDLESGALLHWFVGHAKGVLCVAISPDGRHVLSGSSDTTLRMWDVAEGSEVQSFTGHHQGVTCVAFAPDGTRALSGSSDATLRLWDVAEGNQLCKFSGHLAAIRSVAISPGGRRALSGSVDQTVRLWGLPI
jgi:WD40 repeat protein